MSVSTTHTSVPPSEALVMAERYQRDGFLLVDDVIPGELIARVSRQMDEIAKTEPYASLPPAALRKMDNKHIIDPVLHELVSHPAIGRLVAAITGAAMVQVFATQALIKPPGEAERGNVGWHQDLQYWQQQLRGELLTAWVAISDVTPDAGPMRFVKSSHEWGLLNVGDFFSGNLDALRDNILQKHNSVWEETPAVLKPGGVSFHHRLTIHGSGPNHRPWPRKSVAIHVRTDQSSLMPGVKFQDVGWLNDFADENACPVMFRSN